MHRSLQQQQQQTPLNVAVQWWGWWQQRQCQLSAFPHETCLSLSLILWSRQCSLFLCLVLGPFFLLWPTGLIDYIVLRQVHLALLVTITPSLLFHSFSNFFRSLLLFSMVTDFYASSSWFSHHHTSSSTSSSSVREKVHKNPCRATDKSQRTTNTMEKLTCASSQVLKFIINSKRNENSIKKKKKIL